MAHKRIHSFTGNTDHDFTGLNVNTIPVLDGAGNIGDLAWDDSYIYMKTSTGWKRSGLATF